MTTPTTTRASITRHIVEDIPDIDQGMPIWARRTNPIVRRQLKAHWRVFPPQVRPIIKTYLILSAVMATTYFIDYLFLFILTILMAGMLLMPIAFYMYVKILASIISDSSWAMVEEFQNGTLSLLRSTPFSVREIILSKITASVWRRMDALDMVMTVAVFLGMPVISAFYLVRWSPDDAPLVTQGLTIIVFGVSLIRLPLEMFFASSLAAMMGTMTRMRSTAFSSTVVLLFFYFLMINLLRLLPLSWPMQLVVDAVLPIALPLLFIWGSLKVTEYAALRE
jgi:hypothetical protein